MVARYLCLPDAPSGPATIYRDFTDYMGDDVVDKLVRKRLVNLEAEVNNELTRPFTPARW